MDDRGRVIERLLVEALRELDLFIEAEKQLDRNVVIKLHNARRYMQLIGCALDEDFFNEDAQGLTRVGQYMVGKTLTELH